MNQEMFCLWLRDLPLWSFFFSFIEKIVYRYLKPGWIVLICLGSVAVLGAAAFLSCRKQTRKRIHGFCCRRYAVLSPDVETTSALVVESHYAESAPNDPEG